VHELTVTQNILDIALREAQSAHAKYVTDIYLVIGDLSSIIDESVQFYWDIISAGTAAQGAKLHFQRIAPEFYCEECARTYSPPPGELLCPRCCGANIKVVAGSEFYLESIEVED